MRLRIVLGRAENRQTLLLSLVGVAALELLEPPFGLLGGRPLHVTPWHGENLARFVSDRARNIEYVAFRRRKPTTRAWTPRAVPFGLLIALLGAWVVVAALIGPVFNFGFFNDDSWNFSTKQWELQLIPGIVAFVGGFLLMTPSSASGSLGALLAFAAGGWLVVGPVLYPLWSSGTIKTFGSEDMMALRWIGHFYGAGGLILYFAGYGHGLLARRTVVRDTTTPEPATTQRTVTPSA